MYCTSIIVDDSGKSSSRTERRRAMLSRQQKERRWKAERSGCPVRVSMLLYEHSITPIVSVGGLSGAEKKRALRQRQHQRKLDRRTEGRVDKKLVFCSRVSPRTVLVPDEQDCWTDWDWTDDQSFQDWSYSCIDYDCWSDCDPDWSDDSYG